MDISEVNGRTFCDACCNGHLDVAQWMLKVKPKINVSMENNQAFRYACKNGHLMLHNGCLR